MAILEVKNLEKNFGTLDVLKGISFSLEEGAVLSIHRLLGQRQNHPFAVPQFPGNPR